MIDTLAWLVFWIVLAGLVADAVHSYVKGTGTVWQRLLAVGKQSATILTARVAAIGGLGVNAVMEIAGVFGSPAVQDSVSRYMDPKIAGYVLVAAALLVEIARRRTLRVAGEPVAIVGVQPPDPTVPVK